MIIDSATDLPNINLSTLQSKRTHLLFIDQVASFSVAQVTPIEWPLEDSPSGSLKRNESGQSIADLFTTKKIDLVINLPLRLHRLTAIVTHGYKTRRLAVQNHVPLITDVKCAKLFVKVSHF